MAKTPVLSGVGVAELARLLGGGSGLSKQDIAQLLGRNLHDEQRADEKPVPDTAGQGQPQPENEAKQPLKTPITGYRPRYWRVKSRKHNKLKKTDVPAEGVSDKGGSRLFQALDDYTSHVSLPAASSAPDAVWWQWARNACLESPLHKRHSLKPWLKALERAEIPSRRSSPDESLRSESGDIWLIVDYAYDLMPWWWELRKLSALLERKFGPSRLRVKNLIYDEVEELPAGAVSTHTKILILSDLGSLGSSAMQWSWHRQLKIWRGLGAKISIFSPDSACAFSRAFIYGEYCEAWERETQTSDTVVEHLLACLSMVQWCSPQLLRTWRKILGGSLLDEYQVWHHPLVRHQPDACVLWEQHGIYREKFAGDLNSTQQKAVLSAISQRRKGPVQEVLMEEALIRRAYNLAEENQAEQWLDDFVAWGQASTLTDREADWLWEFSERQDARFWERYPKLQALCYQARQQISAEPGNTPLGPGMSVPKKRIAGDQIRTYALVVQGEALTIEEVNGHKRDLNAKGVVQRERGIELFRFRNHEKKRLQWWARKGDAKSRAVALKTPLSPEKGWLEQWRFKSLLDELELEQIHKPAWATTIEQSHKGLFCTLPNGRQLRWCYPTEINEHAPFDPLQSYEAGEKAAWVDEQQVEAFQPTLGLASIEEKHKSVKSDKNRFLQPYPYLPGKSEDQAEPVKTVDKDQYGQFADISIEGVTFRVRWIPPGEFTMGSDPSEPERDDDETPHKVLLTQGFWLAETACTQALWEAVMGKNPSRYKGSDLPVEQVSWEDVERFCNRLNELLPGLEARLPSEAQWEYACRAGRETVFWWGNELSTELANYDGNNPYNNGPEGEYRGKTVPVKSFEANPWGLYQMHGNVYEWCDDWFGDYEEGEVIDPTGPETGDGRVVRGGSWYNDGRWLRAAYRNHGTPDNRNSNLGFRLALGPRPGGAQDASNPAGRGESERSERRNGQQGDEPTLGEAIKQFRKSLKNRFRDKGKDA